MLKIAIVDDEEFFRERIENLSKRFLNEKNVVYEIESFQDGKVFVECGDELNDFDLIFLDVNMAEMDGIETAKIIREYSLDVFIVFVTAYISYSPQGYEVNAIRYLLKETEGFEVAFKECMNVVFDKISMLEMKGVFEFQDGKKNLIISDIIYIESNLHKLVFHIYEKGEMVQYVMYERLDTIEARLIKFSFCRIHKSYLINMKYVETIKRYWALLEDNISLSIAKPRYGEVEKKYITYKGVI